MAYNETLAERIRVYLARRKNIEAKMMFGGLAFLLNGNVVVGVWKNSLLARIGLDAYEDCLLEPHVKEFDITGRPMKGWVMVEAEGIKNDELLDEWMRRALHFVGKLPVK